MNLSAIPIYNAHQTQFLQAMQREAKLIYDYWTSKEYKCLFRRNTDTNQVSNNNSTIFYSIDEPIEEGDLLRFKNKIFLTLNQEEVENDAYFKSNLIETFSNGKELKIPCYCYDLLNVNPSTGEIISVVNGAIELLTQKNQYTDNLDIGSNFIGLGGSYKIVNLYFKSNILHIFVQRQLDAPAITYNLKIEAASQYPVGSTHRLKATATRTESTSTEIVTNPTIRWSSSDPATATVSANGTIMCLQAGTVAISALWVEHNITDSMSIEVAEPINIPKVCEITGSPDILFGSDEIYTATFYDSSGKIDTTITPIWSVELPPALEENVDLQSQTENTVTIVVADKEELVKSVFTLRLQDTDGEYKVSKSIRISGWYGRSVKSLKS